MVRVAKSGEKALADQGALKTLEALSDEVQRFEYKLSLTAFRHRRHGIASSAAQTALASGGHDQSARLAGRASRSVAGRTGTDERDLRRCRHAPSDQSREDRPRLLFSQHRSLPKDGSLESIGAHRAIGPGPCRSNCRNPAGSSVNKPLTPISVRCCARPPGRWSFTV